MAITVPLSDFSRRTTGVTRVLAVLAAARPDLAADALTQTLPWMAWLPAEEKRSCVEELLSDLLAGAETGELRPFALGLAAWRSTAVAWADPEVRLALADADNNEEPDLADSVIARPGA